MNKETQLEVVAPGSREVAPVARQISTIEILEAAVKGGVTSENVAVVKEIMAMRREELAIANKASFNRDFFALKQEIATSHFYADKAAKTDSGAVAYTYCSERELATVLEPILFHHGFTMLFGQRQGESQTTAIVTLLHKDGHDETREFTVRAGASNRMKDATACDTGAATSAWRHLVIKMFCIKSRISEVDNPRNLGDTNEFVTAAVAEELERRVKELNGDVPRFLAFAGAKKFSEIRESKYDMLDQSLRDKAKGSK